MTPKDSSGRWRRWVGPVLVTLGLLILARLVWGYTAKRSLAEAERAVRAAGEPLTLAEFPPPPTPQVDAWPRYEQLLEDARAQGLGRAVPLTELASRQALTAAEDAQRETDKADLELLERWSNEPENRLAFAAQTRQRLAELAPLLQRLAEIAAIPGVAWPTPTDPIAPVADLTPLSRLVHLTLARAVLAADAGDAESAAADVATAVRVANHLAQAPLLEMRLMEADIIEGAARALAQTLPAEAPTEPRLAALLAALDGGTDPDQLYTAVLHARARSHSAYKQLIAGEIGFGALQGEPGPVSLGDRLKVIAAAPLIHASQADALEGFRRVLPLARRPYHLIADQLEIVIPQLEDAPAYEAQSAGWAINMMRWAALSRAHRRLMAAAVGAWRYRDDTGAWPDSLDPLAPEYLAVVPADPMTGRSLQYRPDRARPIIYSLGIDRADNGGKVDPVDDIAGAEGHDVVLPLLTQPTLAPATAPAPTQPAATQPTTATAPAETTRPAD